MNDVANVLLVDDEEQLVFSLLKALRAAGLEASIHSATNSDAALKLAKKTRPEAAVVDLCLDEHEGVQSGFALIRGLLSNDPSLRVIVLTGHGSVENGITALKLGASSFLDKPANISHLQALLGDAIRQSRLRREHDTLQRRGAGVSLEQAFGSSDAMREVVDLVSQASETNQAVMLLGETGTGKGYCASLIHRLSKRAQHKFVQFQPIATSSELISSTLFGHTAGAFTGASAQRRGLFYEASQGTLFLDEIGELPAALQVSLLGVLQDKRYRQIGANEELTASFRFISATNRDIRRQIADGAFREDLYQRICQIVITLPPLRSRIDDIPTLGSGIIQRINEQEGLNIYDIAPQALTRLKDHGWAGNIRELERVLEDASYRASRAERTFIAPEDLRLEQGVTSAMPPTSGSLIDRVEAFKADLVKAEFERQQGNVLATARALGVTRQVIRSALKRMNDGEE